MDETDDTTVEGVGPDPAGTDSDRTVDGQPDPGVHNDADDSSGDDDKALSDVDEWPGSAVMRGLNREQVGTLVLHFAARDVTLYCDGDAGLRAVEAVRVGRAKDGDPLSIRTSTARHVWFSFRPSDVLAATWIPGLPSRDEGMAIDPPLRPTPSPRRSPFDRLTADAASVS